MITQLVNKGVRRAGPLATITVALVAGVTTLYQISNYASQIGTKTYLIKRIHGCNYSGAATWLYIGTGTAITWVQAMPRIRLQNMLDFDFSEEELPEGKFVADIVAFADAVVVEVQIEVEEIG